jgi:hypothetical protein
MARTKATAQAAAQAAAGQAPAAEEGAAAGATVPDPGQLLLGDEEAAAAEEEVDEDGNSDAGSQGDSPLSRQAAAARRRFAADEDEGLEAPELTRPAPAGEAPLKKATKPKMNYKGGEQDWLIETIGGSDVQAVLHGRAGSQLKGWAAIAKKFEEKFKRQAPAAKQLKQKWSNMVSVRGSFCAKLPCRRAGRSSWAGTGLAPRGFHSCCRFLPSRHWRAAWRHLPRARTGGRGPVGVSRIHCAPFSCGRRAQACSEYKKLLEALPTGSGGADADALKKKKPSFYDHMMLHARCMRPPASPLPGTGA